VTDPTTTPAALPTFGARVAVRAIYVRRRRHSIEKRAWVKWWQAQNLSSPREALYIGHRTLQDGWNDYIGEEEGIAFVPERRFRAGLVVFTERSRPVLVPLDALEVL
jgi:hypothetical protein